MENEIFDIEINDDSWEEEIKNIRIQMCLGNDIPGCDMALFNQIILELFKIPLIGSLRIARRLFYLMVITNKLLNCFFHSVYPPVSKL